MTGEISLRGLVLPVGGIKEKIVAAAAPGWKRSSSRLATAAITTTSPRPHATKLRFIWAEKEEDVIDAALEAAPVAGEAEALQPAAE